AEVNAFLDRKFDEMIARNPEYATNLGLRTGYGEWTDRSEDFHKNELAIWKANIDSLEKFDTAVLDAQTKLSILLYKYEYSLAEEEFKWRYHGYALHQLSGVHNDLPSFLINQHIIENEEDAEAYLSRLSKINKVFEQTIDKLKKSAEKGVVPPHFTFKYVTDDIKSFLATLEKNVASNVLYKDFESKLNKIEINEDKRKSMLERAGVLLSNNVKEAYSNLLNYWQSLEPLAKQRGNKGVSSLPDGEAYYRFCLKDVTTTEKSADEIYETGLKEVARIHQEIREIMRKVNFTSDSLQAFFEFVRSSPQFRYSNDEKGRKELLAECNSYLRTMQKVYLEKFFNNIPKAPLVVQEVEAFRQKSAGGAFYENPSLDGTRPGRFYVNTYNMDNEPKYQMEALCYHEGVPGHHMQIALAQELQGIPKFRRMGGNTAYIEGWALYAEFLAKEMGLYQDPYSDFGRLSMELFRAARLVVDVGIHVKQWTREQAIEYMLYYTANDKGDIEQEVERYFLWPAQATGYKVGMIKILELRDKAKKALGNSFDIKKFHDVVLMNGSVPLNVLESLIDKMIEEEKSKKGA
ncbi:MAG: DUF885 domain-containing protein, partial [Chitinophagales bacterium]|nr:DUF885 domain-containing protein [Chitinophagales bacterium]